MPNSPEFKIFPSSEEEAVAMLYVKHQDLTGKSPAEIYTMYQEAYFEILADERKKRKSGWFKERNKELLQP